MNPLLMTTLVMCWTLNPFFKKRAATNLTADESIVVNHLMFSLVLMCFLLLFRPKELRVQHLSRITTMEMMYSFASAVLTCGGAFALIHLLKHNSASDVVPMVQPLVILATVAIGYLVFQEDVTYRKGVGCGLMCAGLYIFSQGRHEAEPC